MVRDQSNVLLDQCNNFRDPSNVGPIPKATHRLPRPKACKYIIRSCPTAAINRAQETRCSRHLAPSVRDLCTALGSHCQAPARSTKNQEQGTGRKQHAIGGGPQRQKHQTRCHAQSHWERGKSLRAAASIQKAGIPPNPKPNPLCDGYSTWNTIHSQRPRSLAHLQLRISNALRPLGLGAQRPDRHTQAEQDTAG